MSEETIAQRVIRVIAKNKKMPPEELSPATRFDDLKMLPAAFAPHWLGAISNSLSPTSL